MARRNKSSGLDELFQFLTSVPSWVGPLLVLVTIALGRWVFPSLIATFLNDDGVAQNLQPILINFSIMFSPIIAFGILVVWLVAEGKKFADRRRLDQQSGADTIANLSWAEFESLLSEAFRRQGFTVEHSGRPGPDGGIDQRLTKAGAVTLVQCKHWKKGQVGVKIVRELLGVVSSERAQTGIVVTSGTFTPDAIAFAETNPIRLIAGEELVRMIAEVQRTGRIKNASPPVQPPTSQASPPPLPKQDRAPVKGAHDKSTCPKCGAAMVRRVAKTGKHAGNEFMGCTKYPECHGIRNLVAK